MMAWLRERRSQSAMRSENIPFEKSREWSLRDNTLVHRTEGFFSVEGVKCQAAHPLLDGCQQPIINQPEVGILGFVAFQGADETHWLFQAKGEPGNTGGVQLAPTVQATFSNYMRRHGGAPTHYLSHFLEPGTLASNCLQSEQGTRFLKKFNRNAVCLVTEQLPLATDNFHWFSSSDLRSALKTDYTLNTDARSVVATAPWRLLAASPKLFSGYVATAIFGPGLAQSYEVAPKADLVENLHQWLVDKRAAIQLRVDQCGLNQLSGWRFEADRIVHEDAERELVVEHYDVAAPDREKTAWDQPLIRSLKQDDVVLLAQERDGILKFLLRPSYEVGLTGGVEFGPSFKKECGAPDWVTQLVQGSQQKTVLAIEQSDEGGRFMDSRSLYRIMLLESDAGVPDDPENVWVTAAELEAICLTEKMLTNEARSVISLLLSCA